MSDSDGDRIYMKLGKKIARMGMGYDKYHVQHDPNIPCGEAELLVKEEAIKNNSTKYTARILHEVDKKTSHARIVDMFAESEAYIDNLVGFHKDAMEFLRGLDVYSNSDRLEHLRLTVNRGMVKVILKMCMFKE